jgi:ABC-type nitrate/sulfonate/bicarbonate transport system substrate-binding protein
MSVTGTTGNFMGLRVGIHPNNLHLFLAERWAGAFAGLDVTCVAYGEGRDSARLLVDGIIDVCGTGSTPPILAQTEGLDVLYVAASAPRPANGGIVTAPENSIHSIQQLKGRRVALLDGSFHTYLLARALEAEGLSLRDVERVEMAPGASLRALGAGEVDAWVAMAPLLDQTLGAGKARLLAACGDTIPNRSVFWTLARRGVDAATLDAFVEALTKFGRTIAAQPETAARLLADSAGGAANIAAWRKAVETRDWSIVPAGPEIIAEQQAEADTLLRHGDLAHALVLADAARAA